MAGEQVAEEVKRDIVDDDDNDDDFNSGFNTQVEDKANASLDDTTETPVVDTAKAAVVETPVVVEPKYVQITEEQLNSLLATAGEFGVSKVEMKRQLDTAHGKIGNLQQVLGQIQAGTQSGKPVELNAEDMAEITAMYPDLSTSMLAVLKRVAGKLKGTGTVAVPFDESKIDQRVQQQIPTALVGFKEALRHEIAAEALEEDYPNWREYSHKKVIGITGREEWVPNFDTEFRKWLATQSNEKKILDSNSPTVIAKAISSFEASKKPAPVAPKPADKQASRIAAAVAPKSAGGHAPATEEEDPFDVGFKSFKGSKLQ